MKFYEILDGWMDGCITFALPSISYRVEIIKNHHRVFHDPTHFSAKKSAASHNSAIVIFSSLSSPSGFLGCICEAPISYRLKVVVVG